MIEGSKEERKEGSAGRKEGRDGRKDLYGRALVAPCVREGKKEGRKEGKEWRGGECWKELWWNCGSSAYYTFSLCYAARGYVRPSFRHPFSNFGLVEKDLIRRHFVFIGQPGV